MKNVNDRNRKFSKEVGNFIFITLLFSTISFMAHCQIQKKSVYGFEERIRTFIDTMTVVDSHEHLESFERLHQDKFYNCSVPDFTLLLFHYAADDIISSGMLPEDFKRLLTDSMSVSEKWQLLQPYWESCSNTAYNRAVLLTSNSLFGIESIDSSTVEELSGRIRKAYEDPSGWFNYILKEKCKIKYAVLDCWRYHNDDIYDTKVFRFAWRIDDLTNIYSKWDIERLATRENQQINRLEDLIKVIDNEFQQALDENIVALKIGVAYNRILYFEDIERENAENIFNKLVSSKGNSPLVFNEIKPLQDYLMHYILSLANAHHLPVQIHTGLQCNNGNIIENSKPTHLVNLFSEYPNIKFILFHGAYPYGGELSTLAKNFINVFVDMSWVYIISPSYSERYLNEWLETVPANKIMAFGGDFLNAEGTYGHLMLAKQIISNVLVEKVKSGYFSEEEAFKIAQMILCKNAISILNLKQNQ